MKKHTHDFLNPKNIFLKFEPGYNYRIFIPGKSFEGLTESEIKLVQKISEVQKLDEIFVIEFLKTEGALSNKKFKLKK
ncbi:Hypothetical protein IALB_0944 [Ignavibacterium album JCM 16511]|uniref:Uncharacterized protein n=1 Tax=Ignavibacterium album (strain DSM 19864 / JCM 16511 / NBRC 101810 / Mat9-16) TaxID=945713 RepID=I0AI49_IGNAJ|nr:hypothetical protein [Ignavibacterium album]AFH48656.1 Hypothetical protein IALB_0944 [Ignavibacterium album JCM 16511]